MVAPPKTPGVYVIEKNAFPNSVVEVATAVPVFIGHTQRAAYNDRDFAMKPIRVTSMAEFETYFGSGAFVQFELKDTLDDDDKALIVSPIQLQMWDQTKPFLVPTSTLYYLYNSIRLFYQNGGATCYIISVGPYDVTTPSSKDDFIKAIDSLEYEPEPTIIVCPDAFRLPETDYYAVAQHMLMHCGDTQSRMALLDVYKGAVTKPGIDITENIEKFRTNIGQNNLNYGVCYFPWLETNIVSVNDVTFQYFNQALLEEIKQEPIAIGASGETLTLGDSKLQLLLLPTTSAAKPKADGTKAATLEADGAKAAIPEVDGTKAAKPKADATKVATSESPLPTRGPVSIIDLANMQANGVKLASNYESVTTTLIHNSLLASSKSYVSITKAIARYINTLPASAAMAGVYTSVDNSRGVWKAPANVSLNSVVAPTVSLSDNDQQNLNGDAITGKSINAIRPFTGLGVLVWGARTLDGNSQDWRYINVRRTMIMIEQSVKLAARSYVFEPNDSGTWTLMNSMISSFLFNLWKQGALAGTKPDDAYQVAVGLGTTMTADDILNGIMNITVLVAIVRPAEFIMLTFQQQMQKS